MDEIQVLSNTLNTIISVRLGHILMFLIVYKIYKNLKKNNII